MKIVVTGGSGKLGSQTVRALMAASHDVLNLDRAQPARSLCETRICDLTQFDDLHDAFAGAHAVVHLAAYQAPGIVSDTETFSNNSAASYNVLKAATDRNVRRVVMASSIAAYGFTYAAKMWPPDYLPLDEDYPCTPQDPYGQSKIVAERLADSFVSFSDTSVVSLRISGVNFDLDYQSLPQRWADPGYKMGTFWSYIDVRDAAEGSRLAAEADVDGHVICNLSHDLSRFREPTAELIAKYLPGTKIRDGFPSHFGGLDTSRAREILGFEVKHHWRDYITEDGKPVS
ncbi:MAG: NAD(P)-dependent oxidoreductase [Rhodospirillaceae bacterium]|jgi:nucleoside-diphosphate-sugar epimerase|nr:NAD(P)-dependent oxidoreductase [Rhodospirillaceae bacterium]MBT5457329.1 NAD(P)-dependent oxidoreductase [Rhodospirillaceae bacterium]